jgi:hypothetical protein
MPDRRHRASSMLRDLARAARLNARLPGHNSITSVTQR